MRRAALLLAIAACSSSAPAPRAPVPVASAPAITIVAPDATPLVDAWASAVGGREALRALGALHARGTYEEGGMHGTIDLWITPRGERREEIVLGPLREVRVFDGTHGWLVDRNRDVRELAGFELDDQLALAFREAFAPLLVDRRHGAVTREGDRLVLAPEDGNRPETVTFDAATHLPTTFVRRDGEKQRTTHVADWNRVGGARLPFSIREETGNPNEAVTIQLETIDRASPPAGAFARPPEREPDYTLASDPVVVPIEVLYGGLIFVKVEVNGRPMSFILDSGAEFTLLNSSRIAKLGLDAVGTFATGAGGGDVVVSYVPHVTTKVGGATISDQIVGAVLLDALEGPLQRPLDGILGYDFISRFVVEIDYAHQTLRLHDRARYRHAGNGTAVPITLEDSTPFFDASIAVPDRGKLPGHFVLDTGCLCEVQLFTPFVDDHQLLTAFPQAKQAGFSAGAGGATNQLTATIPALEIAGLVIENPQAELARDQHGATADPETAGLIGSLVFKRFVLVLDYEAKQAYFDPLP
jgi:hypothetical protein